MDAYTSFLNQQILKHPAVRSASSTFVLKRVKYITQLPSQVPTFAFYCNLPQYIKEPYKRFVENRIREHIDFSGVPIRLFFRKK